MTNELAPIQVIYNLASAGLLTGRNDQLKKIVSGLTQADIDGFSTIPFRASRSLSLLHHSNVAAIENAWNPTEFNHLPFALAQGSVGQVRRLFDKRHEPPIVADALMSPGKKRSTQATIAALEGHPNALYLSYLFSQADSIEKRFVGRTALHHQQVYKSHHYSNQEIVAIAHNRVDGRLWYDPKNVNSRTVNNRVMQLNHLHLLGGKIVGVDLNWSGENQSVVKEYLGGSGWLTDLVTSAAEIPSVRYIRIESKMPLRTQIPLVGNEAIHRELNFLSDISQRTKSILKTHGRMV